MIQFLPCVFTCSHSMTSSTPAYPLFSTRSARRTNWLNPPEPLRRVSTSRSSVSGLACTRIKGCRYQYDRRCDLRVRMSCSYRRSERKCLNPCELCFNGEISSMRRRFCAAGPAAARWWVPPAQERLFSPARHCSTDNVQPRRGGLPHSFVNDTRMSF